MLRAAAARQDLGNRSVDATVGGCTIRVVRETDLGSEHPGQEVIAFEPRRGRTPVDGEAAQSGSGRNAGAGSNMVRQRSGTGNQRVGALPHGVGDDEIQGANLVAAECHRKEIVTFDNALWPTDMSRKSRCDDERSRLRNEFQPWQCIQPARP